MDLLYLIFLLALGFAIAFAPNLLPLFNTNINYEELCKYIPHYCFVLIGASIILVVVLLIGFKIWKLFRKTVSIRQVSENVIGAGNKMDFPVLAKVDVAIAANMGSTPTREKHFQSEEEIRQKIIEMRFAINNIECIKKIKYLGADYIPYTVQLGVILNQCNNVVYYHNFIRGNNSTIKKLRYSPFHRFSHFEVTMETQAPEEISNDEVVVCVESSAAFNYGALPAGLKKCEMVKIKTNCLGRSSIDTLNKLNKVTEVVNATLKDCSSKYSKIHLLLCASSSLCLSIGRSIRVNEMKPILVYDFDNTNTKDPRPWYVNLTH